MNLLLYRALASQGSAAEITLPDTGSRKRSAVSTWDDEDALLGGGWGAGDNPLDLAFEDAEIPRMDDLDEAPEKHRSSDQVPIADISRPQDDLEIPEAPEMPEFDMEPEIPMARPSDVQSVSLPPTPGLKSLNETSLIGDKSPAIGVKKAVIKQVAKRRKPAQVLNQSTEIPKEDMRRWISDSNSVADLVRQPRPLPMNRREEQEQHYDELRRKGQLAEFMLSQPLIGFIGKSLRKSLFDNDTGSSGVKKRKGREDDPKDDNLFHDDLLDLPAPEFGDASGWGDDGAADIVDKSAELESPAAANEMPAFDRRSALSLASVFDQTIDEAEDAGEEEQAQQAKTTEQQERTKKVVVMLKKHFKSAGSGTALRFTSMVRPEPAAPVSRYTVRPSCLLPPSRSLVSTCVAQLNCCYGNRPLIEHLRLTHTYGQAAVAFFECLGLHSQGAVELKQSEPFADLFIASTPSLATFKVKVAA